MVEAVQSVVIVGGGTAGWLTAGIIAARHQARIKAGSFSVTLVESPDIKIIGVGEGTWPTIRSTLAKMGVSETALFRECDAAFKQGGEFSGWTTGMADEGYYHPLMLPHGFSQVNLVPHWLGGGGGRSFCDFVTPQGRLCDEGLAPKMITNAEYRGPANYAYHLDAGKFAPFLAKHCAGKLGVRHVLADVTEVKQRESGDIESVLTRQAGTISGDLWVDCSGFAALLIGKTLGVAFKSCTDILFCDTALAVQVPFETPDAPLASPHDRHGARCGLDLGYLSADAPRRGVRLLEPAYHRGTGTRDAVALYRQPARGSAGAQDPDPSRSSRAVLEEQLCRDRPREWLSGATRILLHRAGGVVGETARRADACLPGGHGHCRETLQ